MKKVTVEAEQTVLDLCLQEYGTLEKLFQVHQDNSLLVFPAVLSSGQIVNIDSDYQSPDPVSVKILQTSKPATGNTIGYVRPSGIGYMQIGVDFKVS